MWLLLFLHYNSFSIRVETKSESCLNSPGMSLVAWTGKDADMDESSRVGITEVTDVG